MADVGEKPEQIDENTKTSSVEDCSHVLVSAVDERNDDQNRPQTDGDTVANANDSVETAIDPNDPARPLREEARDAILSGTAETVQNPETANLHSVNIEGQAAAQAAARAAESSSAPGESTIWDALREGWNTVKSVASSVVDAVVPDSFWNWFNNEDTWNFKDTSEGVATTEPRSDDSWMSD
ncbi:MAG: hypothetical protein K2Z81_00010, partial [Cyanobacteria bacterium]|nr:hypothetical protein [Cyanobacteriota bacterium]